MSTESYATLEKYDVMINALVKFKTDILISAENLQKAGKTCKDLMGSDQLSANAADKLNEAAKKYRDVTTEAQDLAKKLLKEKQALLKLIEDAKLEGN